MPAAAGTRPWGPDEGQFRRDTRRHAGSGSGLTVAFRLTLTLLCQERVPGGHIEPSPCPLVGPEAHRPRVFPLRGGFSRKGTWARPLGRGVPKKGSFPTRRCRSHHKQRCHANLSGELPPPHSGTGGPSATAFGR